jgi:hypothetical protein
MIIFCFISVDFFKTIIILLLINVVLIPGRCFLKLNYRVNFLLPYTKRWYEVMLMVFYWFSSKLISEMKNWYILVKRCASITFRGIAIVMGTINLTKYRCLISIACGSYQDFLDRGLLLTRKLLNQGFL